MGGALGDYNYDGLVDASDYTLWRDKLGSTTNLAADGNGNGVVDAGDFIAWSSHFGQSVGGLLADYNHNGIVDAADYTVWRDHLGQNVTLPNDTTPGSVTQADYDAWKSGFGNHSGSGSGTALQCRNRGAFAASLRNPGDLFARMSKGSQAHQLVTLANKPPL